MSREQDLSHKAIQRQPKEIGIRVSPTSGELIARADKALNSVTNLSALDITTFGTLYGLITDAQLQLDNLPPESKPDQKKIQEINKSPLSSDDILALRAVVEIGGITLPEDVTTALVARTAALKKAEAEELEWKRDEEWAKMRAATFGKRVVIGAVIVGACAWGFPKMAAAGDREEAVSEAAHSLHDKPSTPSYKGWRVSEIPWTPAYKASPTVSVINANEDLQLKAPDGEIKNTGIRIQELVTMQDKNITELIVPIESPYNADGSEKTHGYYPEEDWYITNPQDIIKFTKNDNPSEAIYMKVEETTVSGGSHTKYNITPITPPEGK